ncbi:MAG TPA: AMP-binding protein, partial [Acetobacteraceae bacterium]|nr:AMP-binding protein [Acetobacteraceae bacterium]
MGPATGPIGYFTWLTQLDMRSARERWRTYLKGTDSPSLVAPRARMELLPRQSSLDTPIAPNLRARLDALARKHAITQATLFQVAWAFILARRLNRNDLCFGGVASGRQAPVDGIEQMFGLFITTTPVRVRLDPRESLINLACRIQSEQAAMLDCQHVPLTDIHRDVDFPALFDTLFTFENYPIQTNPGGDDELPLRLIRGHNGNHYPLSVAIIPDAEIVVRLHYSEDVFTTREIAGIAAQIVWTLETITREPDTPTWRIDVTQALIEPGPTAAASGDLPRFKPSLINAIEDAAASHGDNVALAYQGEQVTYAQLEQRANRIAALLCRDGVGPEDIVAIALPRSNLFFIAALGVWKAGGAILPLDPEEPEHRLALLLANARPRKVLTDGMFAKRFGSDAVALDAQESESLPVVTAHRSGPIQPDRTAYMIYTSGSSGAPKAVVVPHRGLLNLADEQAARMAITSGSRVAQIAAFTFDAAISEMAMTLSRGATLVVAPLDERAGPALADFLTREAITHATLTPTALAATPMPDVWSMRSLIVAGEVATPQIVSPWAARCRVLNAYGPTEATVCATMSDALLPDHDVPIGKPLAL